MDPKKPVPTETYHSSPDHPPGQAGTVAGFGAAALMQAQRRAQLATLLSAGNVLKNHLLMRRLTERVHELLRDDLRAHHECGRDYGGRF